MIRPEGLETRNLLAAGIASDLNVVMELGEVSRSAALKGVEVAALIASDGSISFVFDAEASGDYLLKVRHVGEGLTLQATGPAGSASINPGPAGPFSMIALALKAGEYQIKASAVDHQAVFVDWELLLTSGVGQSAVIGSTLAAAAPSTAVPLSSPPGPAASLASSSSPLIPSANWTPAVSSTLGGLGGPVGRSDPGRSITPVGPTSPRGQVTLADAGATLPVGALQALVSVSEEEAPTSTEATPLLTLEILGDARPDLDSLGSPNWIDRLAEFQARAMATAGASATPIAIDPPGSKGLAVASNDDGDPLDGESESSLTQSASSGLIASGVVLASAVRRWRSGRRLLPWRREASKKSCEVRSPRD